MNQRVTVRLLVLNADAQLLLMKVVDKSVADPTVDKSKGFWITLGGRLEPGESLEQAALREAKEETGQVVRLGPRVWYGEQVLRLNGVPTLFKETFLVASIDQDQALSREGWTEQEKQAVKEIRWWSVSELESSGEVIFPACLKALIGPIARGDYPPTPVRIEL